MSVTERADVVVAEESRAEPMPPILFRVGSTVSFRVRLVPDVIDMKVEDEGEGSYLELMEN